MKTQIRLFFWIAVIVGCAGVVLFFKPAATSTVTDDGVTTANVSEAPHSATHEAKQFVPVWERPRKKSPPLATNINPGSLYGPVNVYPEPVTTVVTSKNFLISITSKREVNKHVLENQVQTKQEQYDRMGIRMAELKAIASKFKVGLKKSEVIEMVGEEPATQSSNGKWNYLVFSPHPDHKIPNGFDDPFSIVFVWFDQKNELKDWWMTSKLPLGLPD
ncbi:MAG: hypothetical protein HY300_05440 [Verrucomicrobia bacterium]|nr:hypothetical protein [Verrucomicrobiota bacterium]